MKSKINNLISIFLLLIVGTAFSFCSKEDKVVENFEDQIITFENDTLILTPNESFFSPVGTLRANLLDKISGNIYNKYENYDYIYNWEIPTDTIIFAVNIKSQGTLTIKPEIGIPAEQDTPSIFIYLGAERKELKLANTGGIDTYKIQNGVSFENVSIGLHLIKLQIKSVANTGSQLGRLKRVLVTGNAAKDSEYIMRRYRPAAVHCKWETASTTPVEISVHELTVINTTVNCYQPITTPFGYLGSPWSKNTNTFGGFNFSLWSYGANDPIPPFYQESHLIAVGPGLKFGSYGHEGTGVKPRGEHPYIGVITNSQVIAVRILPGEVYDTYWSYYLDPVENHWKLYGCGKKYNKSGKITYLSTGAFVEVAGPASIERSGHEIRETQYRGWQKDISGNWNPINKMIGTSKENSISCRDWSTIDNKFSMKMGGLGYVGNKAKTITLSNPDPLPFYLKGDYVKELYTMPATFTEVSPVEINKQTVKLAFNITDTGTNCSAEIFYGTEEGLTKEDKWERKKGITPILGENSVVLENLNPDSKYYYRIKIVNDQGITWSFDTHYFRTLN